MVLLLGDTGLRRLRPRALHVAGHPGVRLGRSRGGWHGCTTSRRRKRRRRGCRRRGAARRRWRGARCSSSERLSRRPRLYPPFPPARRSLRRCTGGRTTGTAALQASATLPGPLFAVRPWRPAPPQAPSSPSPRFCAGPGGSTRRNQPGHSASFRCTGISVSVLPPQPGRLRTSPAFAAGWGNPVFGRPRADRPGGLCSHRFKA